MRVYCIDMHHVCLGAGGGVKNQTQNHQVTEWLIRRTLAHVERMPGDGSASTKARALLFQACVWPKMTLFSMERKVPEEVFDAIEDRIDRLAVQYYHVTKKSELEQGFKENDRDPTWDKLRHGFIMVMLKDPRTGSSFRYATHVEKLPGVLDQFYVVRTPNILGNSRTLKRCPASAVSSRGCTLLSN